MANRDKLLRAAQPYLEGGERAQAVFLAQAGPSPWLMVPMGILPYYLLPTRHVVVVVTERAHVLLAASKWSPAKPTGVLRRLPRDTRIGPLRGVWAKAGLLGEMTYIHKKFHGEVASADSLLEPARHLPALPSAPVEQPRDIPRDPGKPAGGNPVADWYPDPHREDLRRYWDGTAWTPHVGPR